MIRNFRIDVFVICFVVFFKLVKNEDSLSTTATTTSTTSTTTRVTTNTTTNIPNALGALESVKSLFSFLTPESLANPLNERFNKISAKLHEAAVSDSFFVTPLGLPCDPNKIKNCHLRKTELTDTNAVEPPLRKSPPFRHRRNQTESLQNISLTSSQKYPSDSEDVIMPYPISEVEAIKNANALLSKIKDLDEGLYLNSSFVEKPIFDTNMSVLDVFQRQTVPNENRDNKFIDILDKSANDYLFNLRGTAVKNTVMEEIKDSFSYYDFMNRKLTETKTENFQQILTLETIADCIMENKVLEDQENSHLQNISMKDSDQDNQLAEFNQTKEPSYYTVPAKINFHEEPSYIPVSKDVIILYDSPKRNSENIILSETESPPLLNDSILLNSSKSTSTTTTPNEIQTQNSFNRNRTMHNPGDDVDDLPLVLPPFKPKNNITDDSSLLKEPCICTKDGCTPQFCDKLFKLDDVDLNPSSFEVDNNYVTKKYNLSPLFAGRLMALKNEKPLLMLYDVTTVSEELLGQLKPNAIIPLHNLINKAKYME